MRFTRSIVPATVVAALMLPIPALADRHDRQHNGSQRRAAADQSVSVQHAVPRAVPPHQVVPAPRTVLGAPRYQRPYAPRYSSPVIVAPRVVIPRVYAYRPYVFRPRFSLGFGVFVGYPVPYTYPYPYSAPIYGYRTRQESEWCRDQRPTAV
jgi:hypothetical protein